MLSEAGGFSILGLCSQTPNGFGGWGCPPPRPTPKLSNCEFLAKPLRGGIENFGV